MISTTGKYGDSGVMVLDNLMNTGMSGYPAKWYRAIAEHLHEAARFKRCWDTIWSSNKFRFGSKASDLAVKFTLPIIKKAKNAVLWDLGAGTGRDSVFFTKFCKRVACVEISKAAADTLRGYTLAKNIQNIDIINDDVWSALKRQNSLKSGFVDIVHAHSFLHYTKSLMTGIIFSEIFSLLKKGGHLVLALKGKGDHLFGKGKKLAKDTWVYEDGQRRKFYDESGANALLEKMGFKVELIKTEKENFDDKISEFVIGIASKQA